jgi:dolichyl-diphosphooligosaccharide--protein glycosyltransferase
MGIAFALRMTEWPSWQNPEYRIGPELLLATHDAYHWVAGAEGIGLAVDHPMARMLRGMAELLHTYPAAVAFWFPAVLATFVAGIVFAWVWALGSMEAAIAAGVITTIAPGFLGRTLLGYYDTDLVTLFFPLLMTLAPATWAMRHMIVPRTILNRIMKGRGAGAIAPATLKDHHGNPLSWQWVLVLSCSGLVSWWSQEWHSVFPYLIRYNVLLLAFMCLVMAPRDRRRLLLLGAATYALPTLAGVAGFFLSFIILAAGLQRARPLRRLLTGIPSLAILWTGLLLLLVQGDILTMLVNHVNAYLKQGGDTKGTGEGTSIVFPSVAQSIIEVQDLSLRDLMAYFHPWMEATLAGFLGFLLVLPRSPGALFLLPLAVLSLLSTKLGGRMVMFGAPIMAIGVSLPCTWILRRILPQAWKRAAGTASAVFLLLFLVLPFMDIITAMSQGPMINKRHAQGLYLCRTIVPPEGMLWLWWDWGYAAHHFARRATIADGAQHAGPSLYLPAAVFATDNPRFARQLIRYTAASGDEPGAVFRGMNAEEAQDLMDRLRSSETPLLEGGGRQFVVVSFEMLRLSFWISNFGNWNFLTRKGEGGALSIVPQALAYQLETGAVRLQGNNTAILASSITVFEETGVTRRNYLQEWFDAHPQASREEQLEFLSMRRNVNFLFNRVTGEKLAMDEGLYNSLMVQLLVGNPKSPEISPYFKLLYDNVFVRIYEVL